MANEPIRDAATDGEVDAPSPAAPRSHVRPTQRALEVAFDRDDLERRWSEATLTAEGGGAARVWILSGSARGTLKVMRAWPDDRPSGEAMDHELEPLQCGGAVAEAWRDRRVAWSREPGAAGAWMNAAAVAAVSYRADSGPGRLLVAAWDGEAGPSPEQQERFTELANWGQQLARTLDVRESERRLSEQRAALIEWARAAAASHHLSEGQRAAAKAVLHVSGADVAGVWTLGVEGTPRLVQTAGDTPERESLARVLQSHAEAAVKQITLQRCGASLPGIRRALLVPVVAFGQVLGVIGAIESQGHARDESAGHEEAGPEPLFAIADVFGMLLDRAARADAQRAGEQQARELRARLRRRERLATVGERAADVLAEARHPLASIGAFARRAHRELADDDPRRDYLEVILRESERLERLVAESAEPLAPEPARFRMESLNAVLQDVLPGVGEKLVRRRVRLLKRLDPESPKLLLDVERIRHVFRNVIERAVESVPVGGRVRVESRLIRDHVIAEIAFDGGHSPGDLLEELFVPFSPGAANAAPALGVADQIIRQHGGEIRVRSDGEWGATILITLPVRGNEERRRTQSDRRLTRPDRREPASAG